VGSDALGVRLGDRGTRGQVEPFHRRRGGESGGEVGIGLAAFGLGLPLGGLVTRRRRRRAREVVAVGAQVA